MKAKLPVDESVARSSSIREDPSQVNMSCVPEVALDNSALAVLLNPQKCDPGRVAEHLRRMNARLILLPTALLECMQGSTEHVAARFSALAALAETVSDARLALAAPLSLILRYERRALRLGSTPTRDRSTWQPLLNELRTPGEFEAEHNWRLDRATRILAKEERYQEDVAARAKISPEEQILLKRDVRTEMTQLRRSYHPDEWPLCDFVYDADERRARAARDRLAADPWASRTHAALCGMMRIAGAAAITEPTSAGAYGKELRLGKGDWVDAEIVANAAYCPFLLSDDRRFRARMALLARAGLSFTLGCASNAFLAGLEPRNQTRPR